MTSTVDLSAALAPAAARFDRQREDARQQHWMAQLEQAMLAQQLQPQPQGQADLPRPDEGVSQDVKSAAAGRAGASVPAAMPQAGRGTAQAQGAGQAQPGGEGARRPSEPGSAPEGMARQEARGVQEEADAGRLAGAVPTAGAAAATMALAMRSNALAAHVALAPASPTDGAVAADSIEAVQALRATPGLAARGATGAFAAMPGETATWESSTPAAAAGAEADTAPGEEYEKQLLHLFHGDDGVHAYIRDAELTGARLRAVAQALAVELNGSGSRLSGLTVNGRRVSIAGSSQNEEERPATASEAAPLPIIQKGTI